MKPRLRPLSIIFLLVLLFFIALPVSLDSLLGIHVSKYLSWLDTGLRIGGTTITLINVVHLIIFLVFFTFLSRIIKETLQKRVLPRTRLDIGARATFVSIAF